MKTFLEAEGFEVESFDSAQEAIFSIGAGGGDMVITGLVFSEMEGEEFFAKISESFSGPVIVMSSSMDSEREGKLIDLGALAALSKTSSWKNDIRPHLSVLKQK